MAKANDRLRASTRRPNLLLWVGLPTRTMILHKLGMLKPGGFGLPRDSDQKKPGRTDLKKPLAPGERLTPQREETEKEVKSHDWVFWHLGSEPARSSSS